jgi:LacI family transcriptional regulator
VASGPPGAAAEEMASLLDLPVPPTAVVAGDGVVLLGVLRAAQRLGLRVGTDLAVVAHDDVDWAELLGITTTAQPVERIATTAVRLLIERIAEPDRPASIVRIPPVMMHRQSCGCP